MAESQAVVVGVDVGTECVKAVVLDLHGTIRGRAVVTTKGDFNGRAKNAMEAAVFDAGIGGVKLVGLIFVSNAGLEGSVQVTQDRYDGKTTHHEQYQDDDECVTCFIRGESGGDGFQIFSHIINPVL